jgi:hypothetical protein
VRRDAKAPVIWETSWSGAGDRAWSSALAIVGRGTDGAVVEKRGLQAGCTTGERRLGSHCTAKRGPAQRLEGADFLGTLRAPLPLDGALGLQLALFRVDEGRVLKVERDGD